MGFLLVGFSAGTGFFFWRSDSGQTNPDSVVVASSSMRETEATETAPAFQQVGEGKKHTDKTEPTEESVEAQAATPSRQATIIPTSPLADTHQFLPVMPVETASETFSPEQDSNIPPLAEEQDTTLASLSAVQHSPFVTTPPAPREQTSTRREAKQMAKRPPAPVPPAPGSTTQDSSPYKVLMPNGATRAVGSSTPPPTNAAPSTVTSGTSLSFLQWSSDPERRIAFLRINGGPLTMAHEGDAIGGYTVVEIRQDGVELQSGETRMTLRPQ